VCSFAHVRQRNGGTHFDDPQGAAADKVGGACAPVKGRSQAMRAASYEKQGAARDVLVVGDMDDSLLRAGEVRITDNS
jgi:hypothetical protein